MRPGGDDKQSRRLQIRRSGRDVRVVVSSARELSSAQRARVRLGPTEFVNRVRLSPAALEQRVMAMLSGATGAPDRLPTTRPQ